MSLQEKFQITIQKPDETGEQWASFEKARKIDHGEWKAHLRSSSASRMNLNELPPGMELSNQCNREIHEMPLTVSGSGDVTDTTTPEGFREGFVKMSLDGADDQYTGEHVDHFYGDAGGFVERNNYLDRE
jgi:hypothetical protein